MLARAQSSCAYVPPRERLVASVVAMFFLMFVVISVVNCSLVSVRRSVFCGGRVYVVPGFVLRSFLSFCSSAVMMVFLSSVRIRLPVLKSSM